MTVFTISSANYANRALAALESHRRHAPRGTKYHYVICERPETAALIKTPSWLRVSTLFDVGVPDPMRLSFRNNKR